MAAEGEATYFPLEFPAFLFVAEADAFGFSVGPFDVLGLQR